jgi:hypothetical protein
MLQKKVNISKNRNKAVNLYLKNVNNTKNNIIRNVNEIKKNIKYNTEIVGKIYELYEDIYKKIIKLYPNKKIKDNFQEFTYYINKYEYINPQSIPFSNIIIKNAKYKIMIYFI